MDLILKSASGQDEESRQFFLNMFAEGVPENEMPTKPLRPTKLPATSAREEKRIDIASLPQEAVRQGKMAFTLLFSAFSLTLAKYCNSGDVVLGLSLKGRSTKEAEAVGMFVNTLPVRVKASPDEKVDAYIQRVSETLDGVKTHQSCTLESLVPLLAPDCGQSRNPVFDVVVNYLDEHEPFDMGGVRGLDADLNLEMLREGNDLRLALSYSPELYDPEIVKGMLEHFETVVKRLSFKECTTIGELSKITDAERKRILEYFAGKHTPQQQRTVVDVFRDNSRVNPADWAVHFKERSLSYGQLGAWTDSLAAVLRKAGVGRGAWVGILTRRSEMMPVCALGALKSGAAYVPLDPTYPPERLEYMLEDSGATLAIVDTGLKDLIPGFKGKILDADEIRGLQNGAPTESVLSCSPILSDPFVLLYTSGTTGQPKGVTLTHANLSNFCEWITHTYNMGKDDIVAAYASFGFDACLMDMFPALTVGAAIDIVPQEMRLDLPGINNRFNEKGVSIAFMTTQLGRQFAEDVRNTSLRILAVGGETLVPIAPPENYALYNLYGPTECTILCTFFNVDRYYERVPLGKPPYNTAIYIVDKAGRLAPIGTAGELCIAGRCVGSGYLNRSELTAEKFIKNPFSDDPDFARMYKTGDVARFLPDGNIDFIGRSDFQVKIRGFRVELTEIELRVRDYPDVKDAAVVPFDAPGGGKCAVAYVVSDSAIDVEKLNGFIEQELPPYMVPAATVQIETIPLNQNGKVDRRKLPPPTFGVAEKTTETAREYNDLEKFIAEILTGILGHSQYSLKTNLLRAGLTSLSVIRFCSKLDDALGVAPSVPEIMKAPTLIDIENAILRKLLSGWAGQNDGQASKSTYAYENGHGFPLSQNQAGVCFDCMKRPDSTVYNIPFRLTFPAAMDVARLTKAVSILIDAHPIVKSRLATIDGELRQIPSDAPAEVACDKVGDAEIDGIARDFIRPFNLFNGPLYRARVLQTTSGVTLLADFHHIVFDGTSLDIFVRELNAVYEDEGFFQKNRAAREKITGYDWAVREAREEGGAGYLADKEYFDGQLAGFRDVSGVSELTADTATDKNADSDRRGKLGETAKMVDGAAVEEFTRSHGVTPAGLFLSAVGYAVGRWVNARDVYISTISSGRSEPGLKNSFGMFVRTLPLALHIKGGGLTALDFARSCGQKLTDAMLHEKYPFTKISQEYGFEPSIVYACQLGLVEEATGGMPMKLELMAVEEAQFKLGVFVEEYNGAPAFVLRYDSSLYTPALMERFAETLTTALANIIAQPNAPLSKVSLVSPEAREMLDCFNQTFDGSPERTLTEGFNASVRKCPNKLAVIACDARYTYARLNERVNKLANALIDLGVQKEDRVAFVMRRTSRVIVAMFGILKAGCAYIPIDPDYPAERVRHILTGGGAKFLLTTPDLAAMAEDTIAGCDTRVMDFDSLLEGAGAEEPAAVVTPDMLAYILFTSGSTGKPKGVMIEHRGIANFVADDERNGYVRALVENDCVMLSITTIAFDMFGIETLIPLYNGLTTVLADDETAKDPVRIAELFEKTGANAIDSQPARLIEYTEYRPLLDALRRCKVVVLGGEKFPSILLDRLKKDRQHNTGIFNIYGPTEISIACNATDLSNAAKITVGPPLYNVREIIADADGNELPPGVVGELWAGGRGVGRGYINLPEQTAERFVTFDDERFYRCGDYARWWDDGNVEILGRNDNQIKLRGLRIELDEVEKTLSSVPGIRTCAVIIRGVRNFDHLCAYYVADDVLEPETVKEAMAKSLPKYMIPTAYLRLAVMPKTPNGKNDLRALPEPELLKTADYEAPQTALEEELCSIFAHVLNLETEKVGAKDSFFDLGGSSLAVTRIVIEAKERNLGGSIVSISYSDVFAHPTPRELAALLAGGGSPTPPQQLHAEPEYDYQPINELLSRGTLDAFRAGSPRELGNVLLTGATGFLGAHVLRALSAEGGSIFCLLRKSRVSVEERLKNIIFYYFEDDSLSTLGRLHTLEGDITSPESLALLERLPIDTIVNCAANVTHFAKDTSISDVNMGGVLNLIDFAMRKKARLVQISTVSVAGFSVEGVPPKDALMDETMLFFGQNMENQYVHSKFMAERAILEAVSKGLDAKIMRLGNLMARNRDGEFQINANANTFLGSLRAYHTVGCFPYSGCLEQTDLSPIDSTAKAVLLLSKTPAECIVFHPFSNNAVYLGDIVAAMNEEGLKVALTEDDIFARALSDAMKDGARAERLTSLIAYQNVAQGRAASMIGAKNAHTSQALYRMGFRWPDVAGDYLHKFLRGMIGLGYFDTPQ